METINGEDFFPASDEVDSHLVHVTPTVAAKWLQTQTRNRTPQIRAIAAYRSDMVAGRWKFSADPIRFDADGHLIDGQNRLTALSTVPDPDISLEFLVVRGLEPDAQLVMDQGARRTAAQQLGLQGVVNGAAMAAGARLALMWERDQLFRWQRGATDVVTNNTVIDWVHANPEIIAVASARLSRVKAIGLRASVGTAFTLRMGMVNADDTGRMFEEMYSLTNLPPGSPTLTMVKRIQRVQNDPDLKMSEIDQLGFLIYTWNHWVAGRTAERLQRPKNGWASSFPKVDRLPKTAEVDAPEQTEEQA